MFCPKIGHLLKWLFIEYNGSLSHNNSFLCLLKRPKLGWMEKSARTDLEGLSDMDTDRIIEMAWEDRTPFDAIEAQFGLKESAVKALMKQSLKPASYVRWRKRVALCKTKHAAKRNDSISRFKSKAQRAISQNKISKR